MNMDISKLEQLIGLGYSTRKIAEELNISQTTAARWIRENNLQTVRSAQALHTKIFFCKYCGKVKQVKRTSFNKFCDNRCQARHKWETETKPRIERGECFDSSVTLKKYLVEKHGNSCAVCRIPPMWENKPLTLQVDHIDGDSDNNLPSNLRLLCPNCHSQTDTFGSKGKGSRYRKITKRNTYLQNYKAGVV